MSDTDEHFWKDAENLHHRAMNENAPFTTQDADNERAWMERLQQAASNFRAAIETFNLRSNLACVNAVRFDDFCHDELPDIEQLIEAKRMNQ